MAEEEVEELEAMSKKEARKTVAQKQKRPSELKGKSTKKSSSIKQQENTSMKTINETPVDTLIATVSNFGLRERVYTLRSVFTSLNMMMLGQANVQAQSEKRDQPAENGIDAFNAKLQEAIAKQNGGLLPQQDVSGREPYDRLTNIGAIIGVKQYILANVRISEASEELAQALDDPNSAFEFMIRPRDRSAETNHAALAKVTGMSIADITKAAELMFARDRHTLLSNKDRIFEILEEGNVVQYNDMDGMPVSVKAKVISAIQRALRNQANVAIQQVMRGNLEKVTDIGLIKGAQEKIVAWAEAEVSVDPEFALAYVA